MTDETIIAYRLEPIREPEAGALATAAVTTCIATGRALSGAGGGGDHLSPAVVEALRADGRGKVILDSNLFDAMKDVVERMAAAGDVRAKAVVTDPRMTEQTI